MVCQHNTNLSSNTLVPKVLEPNTMKFKYWAILFYFWLIWSWIVYFILLSGLVIFRSIKNIDRKSEVLPSIGFLVASSKGVNKLLIWEFKFKNCDKSSVIVYNIITSWIN